MTYCNQPELTLDQLITIPQVRSFKDISDSVEDCLVQLRIDNGSNYFPWSSSTDMENSIRLAFILLFGPIIIWYIYIYIIYVYFIGINKATGFSQVEGDGENDIIKLRIRDKYNQKGIGVYDEFTKYIWVICPIVSFYVLIYSNSNNIITHIFAYENRALSMLILTQWICLCQGICIAYSQFKLDLDFKKHNTMLKMMTNTDNLHSDRNNPNTISPYHIKNIIFPSKEYLKCLYIDYILFTWNVVLLIALNIVWINIWNQTNVNYYTTSVSASCNIFALLIIGYVDWYPFTITSWYDNSLILFPLILWFISLFLMATSNFYTTEMSLMFFYTNDSYQAWQFIIPTIALLQLIIVLYLLYHMISSIISNVNKLHFRDSDSTVELHSIKTKTVIKASSKTKSKSLSSNSSIRSKKNIDSEINTLLK